MLDELDAAFAAAKTDVDTRVVVLATRGAHSSAGHDLKQVQAERADFTVEERWAYEQTRYFDYCLRIWNFPNPVVAQVQGACVAAGFMVANMCDIVIAAEDAVFSDPVTPSMGAAATEVLIHPWVMGLRQAKAFLFAGERLGARDALALGMVNKVVTNDELEAQTLPMAQRIAAAPPFALQMVKRSLNRSMEVQGLHQALSAHFDLHQLRHVSKEYEQTRRAGLAGAINKGAALHGSSF